MSQIKRMTDEMKMELVALQIARFQKAMEDAFEQVGVEHTHTIVGMVQNYAAVALDNADLIPTLEVEGESETKAPKVQA